MPKLKAPKLKHLALFVKNPELDDPALPAAPIALGLSETREEALMEDGRRVGGVSVTVGARAHLAVINDRGDPNTDGFLDLGGKGEPSADDPEAAPAIEPPVPYDPDRAYLVVTGASATGKLTGDAGTSALTVGLDASGELTLASCTAYPRTTRLVDAADDALEHFKTVFSLEDLLALRPNETLMLGVGGRLSLSLEIPASCLGDAVAAGIEAVLARTFPIALNVAPTASLSLSAEIQDGFRLYAKRGDAEGGVEFSVRRAASRTLQLDGAAGIRVELTDGMALVSTLSATLARITGLPGALIDRALNDAPEDSLSTDERAWVERAVDLLKLREPHRAPWKRLTEALRAMEKRAREVVPQKVTAGFRYTWRRITSESHLARFRLSPAMLAVHHADVLRLRLDPLMALARGGTPGVSFDRFLGKRMQRVEIGYGFCFGVNEFTFLKSWDSRLSRYIWLRDLDERVQVAFLGRRGYESTWLGRSEGHEVEIDAAMPRFAPAPPRPLDFELGLHVAFSWKNRALAGITRDVADHAAALGVVSGDDHAELVQTFDQGLGAGAREGDAYVSLLVPPAVADVLLAHLAGAAGPRLLARALARALPCGEFGAEFAPRRDIEERMRVYGPVWEQILEQRITSLDRIGALASRQLKAVEPRLARQESDAERFWGWSVRGLVRNAGGGAVMLRALEDLRYAGGLLAGRGEAGATLSVFERALRAASPLWADRFGARTFGALLYLAADEIPGILRRVSRKVSLTWTENGCERVLLYKQGDETA